jgi:hypothetical protein
MMFWYFNGRVHPWYAPWCATRAASDNSIRLWNAKAAHLSSVLADAGDRWEGPQ